MNDGQPTRLHFQSTVDNLNAEITRLRARLELVERSNAELLAALKEIRDASAMILRICVGLGHANKIIDELESKYAGFGKRADTAIKNAATINLDKE